MKFSEARTTVADLTKRLQFGNFTTCYLVSDKPVNIESSEPFNFGWNLFFPRKRAAACLLTPTVQVLVTLESLFGLILSQEYARVCPRLMNKRAA